MSHSLTSESGVLETVALIRSGAFSPLEAVDAAIARIEKLDGPINAIVVRDFDRARDAAKAIARQEARSDQPLYGVPMTVKESFNVAGLPTTWGFEEFRGNIAGVDAAVVRLLKKAGAIIVGKSNVPPALGDWQSNNPVYGRTVNPHDRERSPGGSSGGSAAALASGMVLGEYGSDIAGSIRNPSHFCGVWGHQPTWGAVSNEGHAFPGTDGHDIPLAVAGPLARSGADISALLEVTLDRPLELHSKPLRERRFLYLARHPVTETDDGMLDVYDGVMGMLEAAGAKVERKSELLPDLAAQYENFMAMVLALLDARSSKPSQSLPTLPEWFALMDAREFCQRSWRRLFDVYDFVLAPPFACTAPRHNERPALERNFVINGTEAPAGPSSAAWSSVSTFPGLPSTILPAGVTGGLPCGLQVIGGAWRDRDCIDTATQIEKLLLS